LHGSLPAISFAGLRYGLAFLCLIPFVLSSPSQRAALKNLSAKEWGMLILLGLVFYTLTQSLMYLSLFYLPAVMVSLVLNLTSVVVGMAGFFLLKEHPSSLQWAGVAVAIIGACVYFLPIAFPQAQLMGL